MYEAWPDVIIHLAALATNEISNAQPVEAMAVNAIGTARLVHAAQQLKGDLKAFVLASSAEVYGKPPESGLIDENVSVYATTPYAASKIAAEGSLRASGLPFVIMRPLNTYGRACLGSAISVVDKWILAALTGKAIRIHDGTPIRDFMFRDDHARAYHHVIGHLSNALGMTFNIGTGIGTSLSELLMCVEKRFPQAKVVDEDYSRPGDIPRLVGDATLAQRVLDWTPHYTFPMGFAQAADEWELEVGRVND